VTVHPSINSGRTVGGAVDDLRVNVRPFVLSLVETRTMHHPVL
jgi:hypothetical protein